MPFIDSLDYLNLNSVRRYPLREGSSATSTDGNFVIPDSLLVDATLAVGGDIQERYFISSLFNKLTSFVLEISADLAGTTSVVGYVQVDLNTHTINDDYYLEETAAFAGANGKITIGRVADLQEQPTGEFTFELAATEFEARAAIPSMKGISRIRFTDDVNGETSITGNVTLASRTNLRFTFDELENYVILDAGDGLGLNKACVYDTCVKTIDGVGPDAEGNINLLGLNCLSVTNTAAYTLSFTDTCCTPCSGCDDLADLTGRLVSLENNFLSLKNYYDNLNVQLTTYLSTTNANCNCPTP